MTECKRKMGYDGKCKEEALPDQYFCEKHIRVMCKACGQKIAIGECCNTSFAVCGNPLCSECKCPNHGFPVA